METVQKTLNLSLKILTNFFRTLAKISLTLLFLQKKNLKTMYLIIMLTNLNFPWIILDQFMYAILLKHLSTNLAAIWMAYALKLSKKLL